jgi:4-amino-4-deoxy-L-arabinose transferase-like glycosyltransferase
VYGLFWRAAARYGPPVLRHTPAVAVSPLPRALLAIAAGAFLLRLAYALAIAPEIASLTDAAFYRLSSLNLAAGHGYHGGLDVFLPGRHWPAAEHPPLYPLALSVVPRIDGDSVDAQRIVGVLAGSVTVLAVGLVAARLAGARAGIAAAALCAVYPTFIAADGAIMSESLFGALVALCLLQALRVLERPSIGRMAVLGALAGGAALTRSEGLLLVPLLGLPLVTVARAHRLQLLAAVAAGALVVTGPWVARNWDVYGRPVFTTNEGTTIGGANCRATYYGPEIGGFVQTCLRTYPPGINPAVRSRRQRAVAVDYVREHPGRAAVVAGVRVLRVFTLYDLHDHTTVENRDRTFQLVGLVLFYPVLVAGVAGAIVLWRRRRRLSLAVVLAPVAISTVTAVVTYGLPRLRHIVDISLLVLAGVAVAKPRLRPARGRPSRSRRCRAGRA